MKFGTWLMAMVQPLIAKILLTLGLSVVSIVGMEVMLNSMKASFVTSMNAMPAVWLEFALYLWIGKGIGIIFGALTAKLTLWTIQNATSILGKKFVMITLGRPGYPVQAKRSSVSTSFCGHSLVPLSDTRTLRATL
jgi:hypothetical protein